MNCKKDWVSDISQEILDVLSTLRPPMPPIPTIPLQMEAEQRPGLSATVLASKIIARLPDIGIPTDLNPDGSENIINGFVNVMCEEFVDAIKNDSLIMAAIPIGSINITATGGNAGGPVECVGQNITPTGIKGIMQ